MSGGGTYTPELEAFRWYNDDSSDLDLQTAIDTQGTNITLATNAQAVLRVRIGEIGGKNGPNTTHKFQYRKNTGTWTDLTTTSADCRFFDGLVADQTAIDGTTNVERLTGGGGAYDSTGGYYQDTNVRTSGNLAADDRWEMACCVQLVNADVAHNDTIQFRVRDAAGSTFTDTAVPQITVNKNVYFLDQTGFRFYDDTGVGIQAANTKLSRNDILIDTPYRCRILFKELNGTASPAGQGIKVQFSLNGGTWTDLTTTSTPVKSINSTNVTDGAATSQLLGAGTFDGGFYDEQGDGGGTFTQAASSEREHEFTFQCDDTTALILDTATEGRDIAFRFVESDGTVFPQYTQAAELFASDGKDRPFYRWRNDDGSETTATWVAAEGTDFSTPTLDSNYRLRFGVGKHAGDHNDPTYTMKLEYRKNGGAWSDMDNVSLNVRSADSTSLTNGEATTQQISSGDSRTWFAGEVNDSNGQVNIDSESTAANISEFEFCFQFRSADMVNTDKIEFRVVDNILGVELSGVNGSGTSTNKIAGVNTAAGVTAALTTVAGTSAVGTVKGNSSVTLDTKNDVLDEDFTSDPGWTEYGTGSKTVVGGEHLTSGTGGSDGARLIFTSANEFWAEFDLRLDSGHTSFDAGNVLSGSGLSFSDATSSLSLGYINDSGTVKFRTQYRNDAGVQNTIVSSPALVEDQYYRVKLHWKKATTTVSNDGINQIWVDGQQVLDVTNSDNNSITVDRFSVGTVFADVVTYQIRNDNVKVGTIGAPPISLFGEVGTVTPDVPTSVGLTGVSATSAVGTVTESHSGSSALTGVQGTSAVGSIGFTESGSVGLTGVVSTSAVGTVSPSAGATAALTGVNASAGIGTVLPIFLWQAEDFETAGSPDTAFWDATDGANSTDHSFNGTQSRKFDASAVITKDPTVVQPYVKTKFYFFLDSLSTAVDGNTTMIANMEGSTWNAGNAVRLWIKRDSGNHYIGLSQGGASGPLDFQISLDTWYLVEFEVDAPGGFARLFVDGAVKKSLTGLTTTGSDINRVRSCGINGFQATVWTTYVDDLELWYDNPRIISEAALTGVTGTSAAGAVSNSVSVELTGVNSTSAVGSLGFAESGTVGLTGVLSTSSVGSVSATADGGAVLTGVASTGEVGSLSLDRSTGITGVVSTSAVDTVSPEVSVGLTGVSGSSAVGAVGFTESGNVGITGVVGNSAVGTVIASAGSTVALTGVNSTSDVGTVGEQHSGSLGLSGVQSITSVGNLSITESGNVTLTGVLATSGVGTVTASAGASLAITGVQANSAVGNVNFAESGSVELIGVEATGETGNVAFTKSGAVPLLGVEALTSVGTMIASAGATIPISGVEATSAIGNISFTESGSLSLSGVESTGLVGTPSKGISVGLTGVSGTSEVGTITPSAGVNVPITGVEATSAAGSVSITESGSVVLVGVTAIPSVGTVIPSGGVVKKIFPVIPLPSVGGFKGATHTKVPVPKKIKKEEPITKVKKVEIPNFEQEDEEIILEMIQAFLKGQS